MLKLREYAPGDGPGCLDLLQQGHDPGFTPARFAWLHEAPPLAPSRIVLCEEDGRIVGFYGAIRKTVLIEGSRFTGARDIDPVVHPEYRGRRLFTRMLDFALAEFDDIDFYFNFANPQSAPGFLRCGWRRIGRLKDFVCQLGYRRVFSTAFLLTAGTYGRSRWRGRRDAVEITRPEFEALADRPAQPPPGRVWVERGPAYLRWRYLGSPVHDYRFFALRENGEPIRAAVVRHDPANRAVILLDLLVFAGAEFGTGPFLRTWAREFPTARVFLFHTTPRAARRYFLTNPLKGGGQPFLVRCAPGKNVPGSILDLRKWCLSHGDLEMV